MPTITDIVDVDYPNPSPVSYGAFTKVLGQFARDRQYMTQEEAIRKMTFLPARQMRLEDRGLFEKGDMTLRRKTRRRSGMRAAGLRVHARDRKSIHSFRRGAGRTPGSSWDCASYPVVWCKQPRRAPQLPSGRGWESLEALES